MGLASGCATNANAEEQVVMGGRCNDGERWLPAPRPPPPHTLLPSSNVNTETCVSSQPRSPSVVVSLPGQCEPASLHFIMRAGCVL